MSEDHFAAAGAACDINHLCLRAGHRPALQTAISLKSTPCFSSSDIEELVIVVEL